MELQSSEINQSGFNPNKYKKVYIGFLLAIVFFLGMQFGRSDLSEPKNLLKVFSESGRESAPQEVNWALLWDTIDLINEKYVDRPADLQKILYGAVSGAVAALGDQYSVFLPPKEAEDFKAELKGNFDGIGAEIAVKNQQLVIVAPLDDSPAMKAGLKAGDFILKIDGVDTQGLSVEEAVDKIRGAAGSEVNLTVFRKGETKTRDFKITRAKIEVRSLSHEIRETNGKKIGFVKLRRFGEDTTGQFEAAINEFLLKGIDGLIIDERNNPGGYLETAVQMASNWLDKGQVVVIQKFGDTTEDKFEAKGNNRLKGIPTVIIVNGGSASASEILAGALRDHGLAKLVGEQSFGKGSVQELIDLRDKAQVKLTIAKWLTPSGHDLNKAGLEPDEKVGLTDEDFNADRDPQLDKAIELLTK